jgi:hypothetical protein
MPVRSRRSHVVKLSSDGAFRLSRLAQRSLDAMRRAGTGPECREHLDGPGFVAAVVAALCDMPDLRASPGQCIELQPLIFYRGGYGTFARTWP